MEKNEFINFVSKAKNLEELRLATNCIEINTLVNLLIKAFELNESVFPKLKLLKISNVTKPNKSVYLKQLPDNNL